MGALHWGCNNVILTDAKNVAVRQGRRSRHQNGALGFVTVQTAALLVAAALYSSADVNPDGVTAPVEPVGMVGFVASAAAVSTLLLRVLVWLNGRQATQRTRWGLAGAQQAGLILGAMVWYCFFWLPSPYVTQGWSDHFTYLDAALDYTAGRRPDFLTGSPLVGSEPNVRGTPWFIAILFESFGESTFYVIAVNALCLGWAALCLGRIHEAHILDRQQQWASGRDGIRPMWFATTPVAWLTAGIVTRDSFVLLGIALVLVGLFGNRRQAFFLRWSVIAVGTVLIGLNRPLSLMLVVAALVAVAILSWRPPMGALGLCVALSAGVLLTIFGLRTFGEEEWLSWQDRSGIAREHATSRFLGVLVNLASYGAVGALVSMLLGGFASWWVPFPLLVDDQRWSYHLFAGVGNIVSLAVAMAASSALVDTVRRVMARKATPPEAAALAIVVATYGMVGLSPAPIPRYRLPLDWAMFFFLANSQGAYGRVVVASVVVALMSLVVQWVYGPNW